MSHRQHLAKCALLLLAILLVGLSARPAGIETVSSGPVELLEAPLAASLTPDQKRRAKALGLDVSQVIRLASLVEREARDARQRALVAAVLLNRLRRGWHLDSRASLAYAVDQVRPGELPARGDHRLKHPANTFENPGLPAVPICMPSAEAIRAVLHPADTQRTVLFGEPGGRLATDLPAAHRAQLERIQPDPAPPVTVRGLHYVVSNERRQFHFRPAVQRLGGVWVGVGAEQNYTMAAWARPSLMVLLDFDQVVVDLHHLYRVAFLEAETPEAFVAFWHRRNRSAARKAVERVYADDRPKRRAALRALRTARKAVSVRLGAMVEDFRRVAQHCFLTDPEQYAHLRQLQLAGRVVAVRGDLTARRTMRQLGAALREQGRTVRVAYLSNAEQYFEFSPDFKRNMHVLPVDEWSVLLRTRPTGLDYSYVLQWYHNYLRWLDHPRLRCLSQIVPRRVLSRHRPVHQVVAEPVSVGFRRRCRHPGMQASEGEP